MTASSTQVRFYMILHDIHVKYRLVWYLHPVLHLDLHWHLAAAEVLSLVGMSCLERAEWSKCVRRDTGQMLVRDPLEELRGG